MITIEADGHVTFRLHAPNAGHVALVGAFDGWAEHLYNMSHDGDGWWSLTLQPGTGTYGFRYLIDHHEWWYEPEAHGILTGGDGQTRSRLWLPPARQEPDDLAA